VDRDHEGPVEALIDREGLRVDDVVLLRVPGLEVQYSEIPSQCVLHARWVRGSGSSSALLESTPIDRGRPQSSRRFLWVANLGGGLSPVSYSGRPSLEALSQSRAFGPLAGARRLPAGSSPWGRRFAAARRGGRYGASTRGTCCGRGAWRLER